MFRLSWLIVYSVGLACWHLAVSTNQGEVQWLEVRVRTHLSLVLGLESQPSLDAASRLQEGLALSAVRQVADEDAGSVHAHEQHSLSRYLQHRRADGRSEERSFKSFCVLTVFTLRNEVLLWETSRNHHIVEREHPPAVWAHRSSLGHVQLLRVICTLLWRMYGGRWEPLVKGGGRTSIWHLTFSQNSILAKLHP